MIKRNLFGIFCILLFCSHIMFLKMDSYFLAPNQNAIIDLFNGTFEKSDNVIDRNRMFDASLVQNGERKSIQSNQWTEEDSITKLHFKTGKEGTYLVGVSTKARHIKMDAEAFNEYLNHEGVKDLLQQRTIQNTLNTNAVEKYSKHVKAIFQVGDKRTDDWQTELSYPIEFIPLSNPYEAHTGDTLRIKLLRNGQPLSNQLVYADYRPSKNGHVHNAEGHSHDNEKQNHTHQMANDSLNQNRFHSHTNKDEKNTPNLAKENVLRTHSAKALEETVANNHIDVDNAEVYTDKHASNTIAHTPSSEDTTAEIYNHSQKTEHLIAASDHTDKTIKNDDEHTHASGQQLRTDSEGIISVNLSHDGIWYLHTIDLVATEEKGLTHESNWATLTFEIAHSHKHTDSIHMHGHDDNFSTYAFWIVSFIVFGGLFLWFNRKKKM